jgi:hypothetical protein
VDKAEVAIQILIESLQRDVLAQIVQSLSDNLACKIRLCILYSWGRGNSGAPMNLFEPNSRLEWTLKNTIAPVDEDSVRDAIAYIEATTKVPVPSFDLSVRYLQVEAERYAKETTTIDLAHVRYRPRGNHDENGPSLPVNETLPVGSLHCEYNRHFFKDLHRHSWMWQQEPAFGASCMYYIAKSKPERCQELDREYAKAFPENVKVAGEVPSP